MWPGQFPDMASIEGLKKQQPSEIDFLREYMLLMVPDGNQLIYPKDIQRYEEKDLLPRTDFKTHLILIDPAVSSERNSSHDKTAIISLRIYGSKEKQRIYISPNPINDWLEWPQIIEKVKNTILSFGPYATYKILVEGGSTQKGLTQMLKYENLNAQEVTPHGNDKRTRISMLVQWLSNKILFPQKGTEELERQLTCFGAERYDDLVDALTLIPLALPEMEIHFSSNIRMVRVKGRGNRFRSEND
jgi:predicted phage terminase large subunit-like protein